MFKMLIVDDDEIICEGIATCFDWKSYDITTVDTANNSAQALNLIRKNAYDIVITDIRMPFMDGIELANVVVSEFPNIKIILCSAYKDFGYAQKAIDLNLFQYITKPFTDKEITDCIIRVKNKILSERQQHELMNKSISDLANNDFVQFITYGISELTESMFEYLKIPYRDCYYCVGIISIQPYQKFLSDYEQNLVCLEIVKSDYLKLFTENTVEYPVRLFKKTGNDLVILSYSKLNETDCISNIHTCYHIFSELLKNSDNCFYTFSLGQSFRDFHQINTSFLEANYAIQTSSREINGEIINYNDQNILPTHLEILSFTPMESMLLLSIEENKQNRAAEVLDRIFDSLTSNPRISFLQSKSFITNIFMNIYNTISNSFQDEQAVAIYEDLLETHTIDQLKETFMKWLILVFFTFQKQERNLSGNKIMNSIKDYIELNYSSTELNLNTVADIFHISSSYLCYIFRTIENTSFVNYLTKIRMKYAKELLTNTDIKTYELAYQIGYNSPQYFNYRFKKYTGLTPSDYKMKTYYHTVVFDKMEVQ